MSRWCWCAVVAILCLGVVGGCKSGDLVVKKVSWELSEDFVGPVTVRWEQSDEAPVRVEYLVDEVWQSTHLVQGKEGANRATVVGVPFGTTSDLRVVTERGDLSFDASTPIVQRDAPSKMPLPTISDSLPERQEPTANYILLSINQNACAWCPGTYWLMIIDRQGRPVWATKTPPAHWILYAQISASGDSVLWDDIDESDDYSSFEGYSVARRSYLDAPIEEIEIPGHHHAMIELPDGTLAWAAGRFEDDYTGYEAIMERAPGAEVPDEVWRCDEDWPALSLTYSYSGYKYDGCFGSNALWYDSSSDTYQFSWYSVDSVVEIDRSTGESVWWSESESLGNPGLGPEYGFDPPSSRFDWQHGVQVIDDGNLLLSTDDEDSTLVREYEIDHEAKVLREVWSFDPGISAEYNGDVRRLANGNTLHGLGAASVLYEVTHDGTVVWRAEFARDKLLGRADLIEDLYNLVAHD